MVEVRGASLFVLLRLAAEEVVYHGRVPDSLLLKALLSKALGYAILVGSTIVKVPQLLAVIRARSAAGLSPLSVELETLGYSICTAYGLVLGLPISAYGEVMGILVQNVVLLGLIYKFQRHSALRPTITAAYLGLWATALASGAISRSSVAHAFDFASLLFMVSRVPQILQSFAAKSTGHLSGITYALNVAGGCARVFTSIQEGAGAAMLRGALLGASLNAVILFQILYYGRKSARAKTE
ncbi:hypothetical protein QBZ16_003289 [Prototheca wickerhamii]|uniref:Mannose-P-dolichol utilization defect 1 protein homolog n=1 Tax=Prototheca wickerhamii TaxID=3111 RepID=A0AAD9MHE6_PROWI|nr:hypothetical protein QBZ16_003289 [Prototheca wickerhamii]